MSESEHQVQDPSTYDEHVHCPKCGHKFPNPFRDPHSDPNAPQYAQNRFGGRGVGPSKGVRGDQKADDA